MIDEKELERVCRLAGLMKVTTAKVPTWRTFDGKAGLELIKLRLKIEPELRGFWFVEGERNYDLPMDESKICSVLGAFEKETSAYKDIIEDGKKVGEELKEKNIGIVEDVATVPQSGAVLLPDTLTLPLLEKWKKMSTFERMLMFQKTDSSNIEERKGFKKPDGTFEMLKYVKGNFMLQEANIAFLFAWSSKIDNISIGQTAVAVYGSISVEIDGKQITRACVGVDEINTKVTPQHAIKNAATDMVKKGLASLGFNGDVYRGEV